MTDLIIIKYSEIADRPNTSEDPLIPKEFQEKYEEALKRSKNSTVRKYVTTAKSKITDPDKWSEHFANEYQGAKFIQYRGKWVAKINMALKFMFVLQKNHQFDFVF